MIRNIRLRIGYVNIKIAVVLVIPMDDFYFTFSLDLRYSDKGVKEIEKIKLDMAIIDFRIHNSRYFVIGHILMVSVMVVCLG